MEVEILVTKEDYKDFFKYYYFKKSLLFNMFVAAIIAAVFIGGANFEVKAEPQQLGNLLKELLAGVIIFALITFLPYLISLIILLRGKIPLGRKKFIISDTGVQIVTKTEHSILKWESIKTAGFNERFIYVMLYSPKVYILPATFFKSENEISSFVDIIQNNAARVRGRSKQRELWQLYWWGLLGVIPLIGAFVGFFLLLRGILDFKDKYLILIGAICILFTIGFLTIGFLNLA